MILQIQHQNLLAALLVCPDNNFVFKDRVQVKVLSTIIYWVHEYLKTKSIG